MDHTRRERIAVETERQRVVGDVLLPAEITDHASGETTKKDFIAVARDHVQLAYEAE
jgi:hypothetical protein